MSTTRKILTLPIFDFDGKRVGKQIREKGKPPLYRPRGIKMKDCSPYIGRITDSEMVLVCEGPTDANACMEVPGLESWSIVGVWSSTTFPDRSWWDLVFGGRRCYFVSCGDNDGSGKSFNQRVANAVGGAYTVTWPPLFRNKGDARDYIDEHGASAFKTLVQGATMRNPLRHIVEGDGNAGGNGKFIERENVICRIVRDAGGQFCYSYGNGDSKWLCPLHNDVDDPSLTVNDKTGAFCCWAGCGKGGPVQFLMAWKNIDRKSATELLRKYV